MWSKPMAGCWHDVVDCCIVPQDVSDHFYAKFSILSYNTVYERLYGKSDFRKEHAPPKSIQHSNHVLFCNNESCKNGCYFLSVWHALLN